ncbi:uncharacterized protein LOC111014774 [Momordica charantia]|uniref:Uncharacterized protein LOC111014774 n=1 Tax=Momordica charantia TaxID=3673 RepID=A0A6J1CVW9_MOMCH|nr:uncharacterized protein LOC111014774 [Momordica charantia]
MDSKARTWFAILLFVVCLSYHCSQASHSNLSREEELELEEQLKLLNRPSITTFETKEGEIIDCVDIHKQPALDHPSLKNHKVQIRPSTYPFGLSKDSTSSKNNVVSLGLKRGIQYYGVGGYTSVYNLSVAQDQSSSSNIWIVGGPPETLNVNPTINGDSLTRMFVYWTDRSTGDWWLAVSDSQTTIGYWPKELFGHLNDGAEQVAWGGIAKPSPNGMSPPLGNGHKPNNGKYNEACYFKSINYIDGNNNGVDPAYENIVSHVSNSDCYGLFDGAGTCAADNMYFCFTFGGPGGNNCRAT